jgi:hypothetical protein
MVDNELPPEQEPLAAPDDSRPTESGICPVPACSDFLMRAHEPGEACDFEPRRRELSKDIANTEIYLTRIRQEYRLISDRSARSKDPNCLPERLMSKELVATYLDTTPFFVSELHERGELVGVEVGREIRFDIADVVKYLRKEEPQGIDEQLWAEDAY